MTHHETLKAYQREHREQWSQGISLRIHRALSWLHRAEQERAREDHDAEFIFLWIAFNSAYTNQHVHEERITEREAFRAFLDRIIGYDQDKQLYQIIWQQYPNVIRSLMNNHYVYQPFWDCTNQEVKDDSWKASFEASKTRSNHALAQQDVCTSLQIILSRLYTLRNQLMHGGATWNGSWNRQQLKDATQLLGHIVPVILRYMMEHGTETWGEATYFAAED
ncbi:MAG: hypothetical protein JJU10_00300 [Idiomarina sp.]|nr:hypothetical protein [Idiomarina sp.]